MLKLLFIYTYEFFDVMDMVTERTQHVRIARALLSQQSVFFIDILRLLLLLLLLLLLFSI